MSDGLKRILNNARLAGINLGLPGQKRVRAARPKSLLGASAASAAIFTPATRAGGQSPDYTLNLNYAAVPVAAESFSFGDLRGYSLANLNFALRDFAVHGLAPEQLRAGSTYILLQKVQDSSCSTPLIVRRHDHEGGNLPDDREFMKALAAREAKRLLTEYDGNYPRGSVFRQSIVVVPPIDRISGKLPWLQHDNGFNFAFDLYLNADSIEYKLGAARLARLKSIKPEWHDLKPLSILRSTDLTEAIRASSGALPKPAAVTP